jgi:hypothetical protein
MEYALVSRVLRQLLLPAEVEEDILVALLAEGAFVG